MKRNDRRGYERKKAKRKRKRKKGELLIQRTTLVPSIEFRNFEVLRKASVFGSRRSLSEESRPRQVPALRWYFEKDQLRKIENKKNEKSE